LVLPPILYVVDENQAPDNVRLLALETIISLADAHPISEHAPSIMQCWLRNIGVRQLQERLISLLNIMVSQV
jgi:hypothetical protein